MEQKRIESYVNENLQGEVAHEMKRANEVARLVLDFSNDERGEQLVNV